MMSQPDLTALVSTRICHDLISPIGAISNGVELLTQTGRGSTPELDLIGDSVNSATAKLRFFRLAFGAVAPEARTPIAEVRLALATMFQGRSSVTLDVPAAEMPRMVVKGLLLALLCQEKCLPLGGQSQVTLHDTGFRVDTTAPKTRNNPDVWALAENPVDPSGLAPGDVQFFLLGQLVREASAKLERLIDTERFMVSVTGLRPSAS